MVDSKTNLVKHRKLARAIIEKSETKEVLNAEEERRAKSQVKFVVRHHKQLPTGFKNASIDMYKSPKTKNSCR